MIATVPSGTRVYSIGDIHGRLDLLIRLEAMIEADLARSRPARTVAVYLGDYVDRGPDSREVIDHLLHHPPPLDEVVHLLGNHEETMCRFLVDPWVGENWLRFGGLETLKSYGVAPDSDLSAEERLIRMQEAFNLSVPERHWAFLEGLPLRHEEGDYLFVHAGVRPRVPLDRQRRYDLLWIRHEFLDSEGDHGRVIVHGHSISSEPEIRANRIGIDTGAFMSGRLTALVLEGGERRFLST